MVISHRGAINTILDINSRFKITSKDSVLAISQLHFDLSVYDIFGILGIGGRVIIPSHLSHRDPNHWWKLLAEQRITIWNSVPALIEMMIDNNGNSGEVGDTTSVIGNTLRVVMMSGDWIPGIYLYLYLYQYLYLYLYLLSVCLSITSFFLTHS